MLAAACGTGSSTTTAGGATATTGGDGQASRQAYRDCLAQNGVNLPARGQGSDQGGPPGTNADGTPSGDPNGGPPADGTPDAGNFPRGQGTIPGVDQATMDAARQACKDLQPTGGFGGGGGGGGGTAFQAYASCMKDHGVTVPSRGNGSTDTSTPPSTIDRTSAAYTAANDACKALLPTPGQGGGGSTTSTTAPA